MDKPSPSWSALYPVYEERMRRIAARVHYLMTQPDPGWTTTPNHVIPTR